MTKQENPTYYVYIKKQNGWNSLYEFEDKEEMNNWLGKLGKPDDIRSLQIMAGFTIEKRNALLL